MPLFSKKLKLQKAKPNSKGPKVTLTLTLFLLKYFCQNENFKVKVFFSYGPWAKGNHCFKFNFNHDKSIHSGGGGAILLFLTTYSQNKQTNK